MNKIDNTQYVHNGGELRSTAKKCESNHNNLALWHVTAESRTFYIVASDDMDGDFFKQLVAALGVSMHDKLPKFVANRLDEPVYGRIKAKKVV